MNTLIVVLGPTGVGKSDISIQLAKHYRTEIISADSRQFYKELCIGTAVPSKRDLNEIPHHFIQNKSIHDYYNVSSFEVESLELLDTLFNRINPVILTGGSMLYLDTICNGIDDIPTVDVDTRKDVIEWYERNGIDALRNRLQELDPDYYNIVDLNNPKRMLHAVEICQMTGKTFSSYRTNSPKERPFMIIKIGINQDRSILYERINQRVLKMIDSGLVDEARKVYPFRELNSLNTVGYKELFSYFDGACSLEEAIDLIQRNSRKYARKQLTWFRRDLQIAWFEPGQLSDIIEYIDCKMDRSVK
jgi:tRNA dimethylallyltransferase